jgi:hypothetical protein
VDEMAGSISEGHPHNQRNTMTSHAADAHAIQARLVRVAYFAALAAVGEVEF